MDTILESAELRDASNRGQGLIVSGCLPQRFRDELPKLLPEVDAFVGIDQVARITMAEANHGPTRLFGRFDHAGNRLVFRDRDADGLPGQGLHE